MNISVTVRVGVATARPPREDAFIHTIISVPVVDFNFADAENDARRTAEQMSFFHPFVVMPVSSEIVNVEV